MISAYARNLLLDWLLTAGVATRPTAWYVSLHTADPGTTGASELLVATDSAYARQLAAFSAPANGQTSNSGALTWTAAANATAYDVTHIGIWDALTAGNFLFGGALAVPEHVVASGSLILGAGRGIARLT